MTGQELLTLAIEKVRPYIPEKYDIDDERYSDNYFSFKVIDGSNPIIIEIIDDFSYGKAEYATEEENMERFYEAIEDFKRRWQDD